jgi:hypothetical protein
MMDVLRRFAPCSCMRIQPVGEDAVVNETFKISVKTTCCRRSKIININISPHDMEALRDVKEIIDRIENNAKAMSRKNSGSL